MAYTKRTLVNRERDTQIVRLRADGIDPRMIAEQYGITTARVCQIWKRALREMPSAPIEERRAEQEQFCTRMNSYLTPYLDDARTAARTKAEIVKVIVGVVEARRAALLGLDAPRRREVELITPSAVDRAFADLQRDLQDDAECQKLIAQLKGNG